MGQVKSKLANGQYNLDHWRRILKNMNKISKNGKDSGKKKIKGGKEQPPTSGAKLSNIVNKILASKTGADLSGIGIMNSDEGSGSDNYDIYA